MAQRKSEQEALIKEFEAVRARYRELFARLVEQRVPGIFEPLAATCGVGEVCHGGTFAKVIEPR